MIKQEVTFWSLPIVCQVGQQSQNVKKLASQVLRWQLARNGCDREPFHGD